MFCPKCKSEYRDGFKQCKECQLDLVPRLETEEFEDDDVLIELTSGIQQTAIGVIKSILDAEGIKYTIFDESTGNLYPVPGANRLMVAKGDYQTAQELLESFL
ncbi:MAG: DUF2007 domain-containing protein [Desulforhopalus sp.]